MGLAFASKTIHERTSTALPRDARFHAHAGAARTTRCVEGGDAELLHPAPRRAKTPLRLSPRARRRVEKLGDSEGAEPRSARAQARRADGRPSAGVRRV